MLNSLIKRLNKDENDSIKRTIITESSQFDTDINPELLRPVSAEEISELTEAINSIELSDEESSYEQLCKLESAISDPRQTITESVVSTSKQITMTKEDYNTLCEMVKKYKSATDSEKRQYVRKFKDFIRKVNTELKKCNDERPADALITAFVNKLCKLYDVEVDVDDVSAKYKLVAKINALAKKMSKI